ncbi:MAG TPA: tetratricopeptide repeat protein [Terriglobia bacterium]|nr:tetratricopeptide repeat protein [Terriglobia bacterium]
MEVGRRTWLVLWGVFVFAMAASIQGLVSPTRQAKVNAGSSVSALASHHGEEGLALLRQGRYKEAIAELSRAVELQPASWKYSLALAEALLSANYNFTGLRFLLKVKPRFQDLAEYHYILGLAYYMCYQYMNAIAEFKKFPQDDPKFSRVPFLIGNCYMALGDLKQAKAFFDQAIKLKPDDETYYVSLGKMLRMEGPQYLDEAIAVLKRAVSLKPQDVYAQLHLADCEEGKGNYRDAETLLEQIVHENPEFQPARLALATAYEHDEKLALALEQREIAARLKPPKPARNPELGPPISSLASQ